MSRKKAHRSSDLLSLSRLIAGIIFAPLAGPLLYYLIAIIAGPVIHVFNPELNVTLPVDPEFLRAGIIIGGFLFYIPAVVFGLIIMIFVKRVIAWNIFSCIAGALLNALLVALFFSALLIIAGQDSMAAPAGFMLLLKLIYLPAILAGISFWFISFFRNDRLDAAL